MKRTIIASLVGCAALAACVSTYKDIDASAPYATFEFIKGYTTGLGFGHGAAQQYHLSEIDSCEDMRRAAFFTWMNDRYEERRVAANRPAYVNAATIYNFVSSAGYSSFGPYANSDFVSCKSARATFMPEAGHRYRVEHAEVGVAICQLRVVDAATGRPPPDLKLSDGCPSS